MSNVAIIICPVDFSEHSAAALHHAHVLARQFGARLIVVNVLEPLLLGAAAIAYDMDLARDEVLPELHAFVERDAARRDGTAPAAELAVLVGDLRRRIAALAEREQAQLIVIGTHGLSGYRKLLVGSTTERLLRHATVPVLLVPAAGGHVAEADSTGRFNCVLVPVDLAEGSDRALRAGAAIAGTLGVPLLALHVVSPVTGIERLRSHLDAHNRAQVEAASEDLRNLTSTIPASTGVDAIVAAGAPAEEIARVAVSRGAGLIVIGLRRRADRLGARTGSVAYRVLGLAPSLILALPPGSAGIDSANIGSAAAPEATAATA